MFGSVQQAATDDDRIVIYQSTDREGSTFSLSPEPEKGHSNKYGLPYGSYRD